MRVRLIRNKMDELNLNLDITLLKKLKILGFSLFYIEMALLIFINYFLGI